MYWFFTSGLLLIMLFIKCMYGIKFLHFSRAQYEESVKKNLVRANQGKKAEGVVSIQIFHDTPEQLAHKARKYVLKDQRRSLNHFFISSTVYYIFLMILVLCLIPIAVAVSVIENLAQLPGSEPENPAKMKFTDILFFMIVFALLSVVSLMYLVRRINWLLIEKDEELRYRSMKIGDNDILQKQQSLMFKGVKLSNKK